MNWIPMKKKQPTKAGYYMVSLDPAYLEPLTDTDYWADLDKSWAVYGTGVVAWAELPEPYREAQNG